MVPGEHHRVVTAVEFIEKLKAVDTETAVRMLQTQLMVMVAAESALVDSVMRKQLAAHEQTIAGLNETIKQLKEWNLIRSGKYACDINKLCRQIAYLEEAVRQLTAGEPAKVVRAGPDFEYDAEAAIKKFPAPPDGWRWT